MNEDGWELEEEELNDSNFINRQKRLSKRVSWVVKELKNLNEYVAKTRPGREEREALIYDISSEMVRLAPAIRDHQYAGAKASYLKDLSGGILSQNEIISFIQDPNNKRLTEEDFRAFLEARINTGFEENINFSEREKEATE
jgi:hypothetical protein